MKKKKVFICFLVIIILVFSIIGSRGRSKTIEGALNLENRNRKIIHEEKTNKGVIVFGVDYDSENEKKGFFTAFFNKNIFGYKDFYSGVGVIDKNDPRDLTSSYFPAIKKTSLPIYFGSILNNEIKKITVNEADSDKLKEAKIIEENGERIWLVYMKGFKGQDFEIIAYNEKGEVIVKLEDRIPWEAEMKAMKTPYR